MPASRPHPCLECAYGFARRVDRGAQVTIVGDLKQVSLRRVLEVVAAGRQTGLLRAKSGHTTLSARIRRGRLQRAWLSDWAEPDAALVESRAPAEHREALKALAGGSEVGAALWLDWCDFAGPDVCREEAKIRTTAALSEAAAWRKGELRFEEGTGQGPGGIDLNLAMTPLFSELRKGA